MNNFKKVVALLCSATLIAGSSVTAFATDTTPNTAAGDGNIIAYSVETVTVPTAIKVSFNPQKWDFKLRSTDTTFVQDQIVSLNYGISSMATMDKAVTVNFTAEGTANADGDKEITFVDAEEKAQPKSDSNEDGAAPGEYKMYLAVAPAAAVVTAAADNTAFAITNGAHNVTGALLADVDMTAEPDGAQAFADGTSASIAFLLEQAEYELKTGSNPDFSTTSMDSLVQIKTLGDIVGFTFIGAMNDNADWTKANLSAIKITPEYEIVDADGTEETVANGGYNQIEADSAVAGVAEVLTYNKVVYLALYGANKTTFTKNATSLIVNTKDVSAKATMINGVLAVKATDLTAAGVDTQATLDATYVVDGVTYKATLTQ